MEYFAPGLRELRRIAARCAHRVRRALARRRLAAAETELGLLGWQQADFDEATERQVDEIQNVEREQARLHNASAELTRRIHALGAERTRLREDQDAQCAQLEFARGKFDAPLAEFGARLAELRKREPERDRRAAEIDREQRKLEKNYAELLEIEPQTPQIRDELIRIRDRLLAMPEELAELHRQHIRITAEIESDEKEFAAIEQQRDTLSRELADLTSAAEAAVGKIDDELRDAEKERTRVTADVEKLESAKLNPYREIGRVLADSGVAPINQPQVLDRVRALRLAIEEHTAALAASHALTWQESRTQLHTSLALLAIIAIALALLIGGLF